MAWLGKITTKKKEFTSTLHPLHVYNFPGMWGWWDPCLAFLSIPLGKATWKELVHKDYSASLYFVQSNALSAPIWWHMIGVWKPAVKLSVTLICKKKNKKRNTTHWICSGRPRLGTILLERINQFCTCPSLPWRLDTNRLQCATPCQPCFGADI